MAQETSALARQIWSLTADLRAASPATPAGALHQARVTLAGALAAGESSVATRTVTPTPPVPAEMTPAHHQLLDAAIAESSPQADGGSGFVIARRETPLALTGLTGGAPDALGGQASDLTLGPFLDPLDRPVWIDLFRILVQVRLVRVAGGTPFLVLPIRGTGRPRNRHEIGPGSVWIASDQLAAGVPAGGFTGLLVRGGSLKFSSALPQTGLEIVVPPTVTCTLSLDLNPGAAPAGTGAGQDARLSDAKIPAHATWVFGPGGAGVESVAGSFRVYGSTVDAEVLAGTATYDAALQRILYFARTAAASFKIKDVRSDQFLPSGVAGVLRVAWALPVAQTSPASLGSASGAGAWALFLGAGLLLAWKGQAVPVPAGPLVILVAPGFVSLAALDAQGLGTKEEVSLWAGATVAAPPSRLTLYWKSSFAAWFFSSSAGSEIVAIFAALEGSFDRPITVAGRRAYVHSDLALILFVESAPFTGIIVQAALQPPPAPPPVPPLAFSIANAVFRTTQARTLIVVAAFDGARSLSGRLALGFGLQYLLPTLPDPYAANFDVAVGRLKDTTTVGVLSASVHWADATPAVLTYDLPGDAASALLGAPAVNLSANTANLSANTANLSANTANLSANTANLPANVAAASEAARHLGAVVLLDLSTNADQFGVAWRAGRSVTGGGAGALSVDEMFLESTGNTVFVLTVPAVQWETVYTDPPPAPPYPAGFPSPLSFPDNGGPTVLSVQSADLVRIAPLPALDHFVRNFTTSATPAPASARLTLPFGMQAVALLNKPAGEGAAGAEVGYNRPTFTAQAVVGGSQISLRAVDPAQPDFPSFPGFTQQLKNTLFNGVPTGRSVLGPDVDLIFNPYLGPGGTRPLVPVTRLDLSGYGESLFSDWRNQTSDVTAVSKVRLDVLVGRTSVEVVQVRSILYPYGVRVVRTITIDRRNTGVVARHDSGWQAASDGEYDFPGGSSASPLVVHPGVVQKITNVANIRDTGQFLDAAGVQVAGVFFDGDLIVDGVFKGAGADGVPARDQIGYIQLTPEASGGALSAAQYSDLIQQAGPLGGGIDCVLHVAASGLPMKVGRVGVGVTQGMGGPEFVMTAWGSPQFPYGGQWSFLKQTGAGTAPELVHADLGVPLIRAGAVPAPPPANSPYRFADPEDLASPTSPASDYGVVHATSTQRVFFPRPKIEADAPTAITSTVAPTLADPYSLANAVGLFPRTDAAIRFPSADYALGIAGNGAITLQMPSPTFPVSVGQRTLSEAGDVRGYADYTGATATVAIDTAAPVPWSFALHNVAAAMSTTSLGEVLRVVGDMRADADTPAHLSDPRVVFGGALGVVQDVLKFLQKLGFPSPMSVSMTNSLTLKMGLKIPMDDELNTLMPPCGPSFQDTDVTVSYTVDLNHGDVGVEFEANAAIFIPTPFSTCVPPVPPEVLPHIAGLQGVGLINFDAKISTKFGQVITLTVGAGIGVTFKVSVFNCFAYYVETWFMIFGDVTGLGEGALLKGSIDLEIVSVDVSIEAKMAVLKVKESPFCSAVTVWGAAQVTFAVDITLCWVIDIDFEVQAEWSHNLNGGPCELPDVL